MAWLEQCKAIFKVKVDGLNIVKPRHLQGVNVIIKQLAKEKGIPYSLLRSWYFNQEGVVEQHPICVKCNKKSVFLTRHGKPLSKASKDYGLCGGCRLKKYKKKGGNDGKYLQKG